MRKLAGLKVRRGFALRAKGCVRFAQGATALQAEGCGIAASRR